MPNNGISNRDVSTINFVDDKELSINPVDYNSPTLTYWEIYYSWALLFIIGELLFIIREFIPGFPVNGIAGFIHSLSVLFLE